MSSGISAHGSTLETIFDPYVAGTTQAAATGIKGGGSDLNAQFAKLSYGTSAASTGIRCPAGDLNAVFAAHGTTNYALAINGNSYDQTCEIPNGGSGNSLIGFKITSGNTYNVYGVPTYGSAISGASGSIPTGAVNIQITYGTFSIPSGDVDAVGAVTNPASSQVPVSSNPNTYYQTATVGGSSGSRGRSYPVTIVFYNSGGTAISTTNITLIAETDGSS